MITTNLLTELKAILPESQIKEQQKLNHPLGNSGTYTVTPTTEEEIKALLKYANENGKKINIAGGGSKRGYGGIQSSTDILLSLENYKGIIEHTAGDMTMTVKAGTTFKELQDYLAQHKQKVALDPFWPQAATIGGVIASNDSGPKRLGYGSARDIVIGLKMVYPDGSVIRSGGKVVKNVAGYDMNKLFIGSMGTLGVISEITVKLRPLSKYESLLLLAFPEGDQEAIRSFVVSLLDSVMEPVALELLNPTLACQLTGEKAYMLAVSFEDVEKSVLYQEEFVKSIQPANTKLTILKQEKAQEFWEAFYRLGTNGALPVSETETNATLKIGVKNLDVLKVIKECELIQEPRNLVIEAHGGLGHGLCQVYLSGASNDISIAIKTLRGAVHQLGGYLVVKHLPLAFRQSIDVWVGKPSYFFLLEGIRNKVDPNRTLNDKRFIGGL